MRQTPALPPQSCCIVGGGPAGVVLALLLARRGIPVTLLEAQRDFDRDFRGDTIHPSILELFDQLGLAESVLRLPHVKWFGPSLVTATGLLPLINFRRLKTLFPYIMVLPQHHLLEYLVAEAGKYPHFRLVLGARVQSLIEDNGAIAGVRYMDSAAGTEGEVRASLVIGADGRFSKVRALAELPATPRSDPMELLWFRLPRLPDDVETLDRAPTSLDHAPLAVIMGENDTAVVHVHRGNGFLLVVTNRLDHWQVGLIHAPNGYQKLKEAGIESFRRMVAAVEPRLTRHLEALTDWRDLAPLSVAFSRCEQWARDGLLLIGDAAHPMTPAAGAGIKYAIEDAIEAANVLATPLLQGSCGLQQLREVQRRRECAIRAIQAIATVQQQTILSRALRAAPPASGPRRVPLMARLLPRIPLLRDLPARIIAFGFRRVRLADTTDVLAS